MGKIPPKIPYPLTVATWNWSLKGNKLNAKADGKQSRAAARSNFTDPHFRFQPQNMFQRKHSVLRCTAAVDFIQVSLRNVSAEVRAGGGSISVVS